MTPLGRLIKDYMTSTDPPLSLSDLERRMHGTGITRSRISDYINKPMDNVPPTRTLRALSEALRAPLHELVGAALDTVDLPRPLPVGAAADPLEEEILGAPKLSDEDRAWLLRGYREGKRAQEQRYRETVQRLAG